MSAVRFPVSGLRRYCSDEPREGAVEINIDWQRLVKQLGTKAAFNKTRKARALHGAVVVKFTPTK